MRKGIITGLLVMAFAVLTAGTLSATSYHAYTGVSSLGNLSLSAFFDWNLYTDNGEGADPSLVSPNYIFDFSFAYGFANNADVYFSPNGWGNIRYDFSGGNSSAIGALYCDYGMWGPEFHGKYSLADGFALEFNLRTRFPYSDIATSSNSYVMGIIAPVISAGNASIFMEINPLYYFDFNNSANNTFDLQLLPGVAFGVGEGYLSVGAEVDNLINESGVDVTLRTWYWWDFGIDQIGEEEEISIAEDAPEPVPAPTDEGAAPAPGPEPAPEPAE